VVSKADRVTVPPTVVPHSFSNFTQSELLSNCGYGSHTVSFTPPAGAAAELTEDCSDPEVPVSDVVAAAAVEVSAADVVGAEVVGVEVVDPVDDEHPTTEPARATAKNAVSPVRRAGDERVTVVLPGREFDGARAPSSTSSRPQHHAAVSSVRMTVEPVRFGDATITWP